MTAVGPDLSVLRQTLTAQLAGTSSVSITGIDSGGPIHRKMARVLELSANGGELTPGAEAELTQLLGVLATVPHPERYGINDDASSAFAAARADLATLLQVGEQRDSYATRLFARSPHPLSDVGGAKWPNGSEALRAHFITDLDRAKTEILFGDPLDQPHPVLEGLRERIFEAIDLSNIPAHRRTLFRTLIRAQVRTVVISFTLERDDGSSVKVVLTRVQHNDARGPYKGGIRFFPLAPGDNPFDANRQHLGEERALAALMTIKVGVTDLPYGGSKGGVFAPRDLSPAERERLFFAYGYLMADHIGADKDIPAPDVGTGAPDMDALRKGYEAKVGRQEPGVVTGKSPEFGGSKGRDEATARGGFELLKAILAEAGRDISGLTFAVNGYGNAGQHAARLAAGAGGRVVAINDRAATLKHPNGIPEAILQREMDRINSAETKGSIALDTATDLGDTVSLGRDAIWDVEADVYFISAKESILTPAVARKLKRGSIVVELANMGVTPNADAILAERGITVVPDALANAGGVTGSYLEWVQNLTGDQVSLATVQEEITKTLLNAYREIRGVSRRDPQHPMTLRQAALVLALERLYDAEIVRNPGLTLPDRGNGENGNGQASAVLGTAASAGAPGPAGISTSALSRATPLEAISGNCERDDDDVTRWDRLTIKHIRWPRKPEIKRGPKKKEKKKPEKEPGRKALSPSALVEMPAVLMEPADMAQTDVAPARGYKPRSSTGIKTLQARPWGLGLTGRGPAIARTFARI